jgi:hypothetical protein
MPAVRWIEQHLAQDACGTLAGLAVVWHMACRQASNLLAAGMAAEAQAGMELD